MVQSPGWRTGLVAPEKIGKLVQPSGNRAVVEKREGRKRERDRLHQPEPIGPKKKRINAAAKERFHGHQG